MFSTLLRRVRDAWYRVWGCPPIKTPQWEECITVRTVDPPFVCVSMLDTEYAEAVAYVDALTPAEASHTTVFTDQATLNAWIAAAESEGGGRKLHELINTIKTIAGVELLIAERTFLLSIQQHPVVR